MELECDLPSEESFFDSDHPYSEPGFIFSRSLTVGDAFEQFFASEDNNGYEAVQSLGLKVLDMFVIIHRKLYLPLLVIVCCNSFYIYVSSASWAGLMVNPSVIRPHKYTHDPLSTHPPRRPQRVHPRHRRGRRRHQSNQIGNDHLAHFVAGNAQ